MILQARTFISPPAAVCCQKADTKGSFFTVRPGPKKLCHRQKLRYTLAAQASDSILLALLVGWLTGKQLQSTCTQTTQVHGVSCSEEAATSPVELPNLVAPKLDWIRIYFWICDP